MTSESATKHLLCEFRRLNSLLYGGKAQAIGAALSFQCREPGHLAEYIASLKLILVDKGILSACDDDIFLGQLLTDITLHELVHARPGKHVVGRDHGFGFMFECWRIASIMPGVGLCHCIRNLPGDCAHWPHRGHGKVYRGKIAGLVGLLEVKAAVRTVLAADPSFTRCVAFLDSLTGPQVRSAWKRVRKELAVRGIIQPIGD